jgi:hypothetical protein
MIYEIRTYTAKPGAVADWERNFAAALPTREQYSKLGGMWHTDIGPLNQIIHIWPYESLQQRAEVRAAMAKDTSGNWPPKGIDFIVSMENEILEPVAGMIDWDGPKEWGSIYELRLYTYAAGEAQRAAAAFAEALPARQAIYPVAGIFVSQLGNLNRVYQLFPFRDWAHRDEVRAEFRKSGVWPPHAEVRPISQLVRYLIPAAFSPLH